MTISSGTDWEVRSTGASTNGGGFKDLNPGTSVDYSQQDAAQLALTDIASDGAGTGISSTTGGFTAAMEGNCMYIGGSGFTIGWYQITGYTDTNNITIDRSCGINKSGGTGNVGGAWDINPTNFATFFNGTNKGNYDTVHIKKGTWTSLGSSSLSVTKGYLRIVGYNNTRNDNPDPADRPFLNFGTSGANFSWSGSYGRLTHMNFDSQYASSTSTFLASGGGFSIRGCRIKRSGYNATALQHSGFGGSIVQCECESTIGNACLVAGEGILVYLSYFHDSVNGLTYSGSSARSTMVSNCIFDTCSSYGCRIFTCAKIWECTVYNCGTGIYFSSFHSVVLNCIIHSCTTGLYGDSTIYEDYNTFYNNTTDRTGGVQTGLNSITSDPLLTDPTNQDFTLSPTSPAFNSSLRLGTAVGLP